MFKLATVVVITLWVNFPPDCVGSETTLIVRTVCERMDTDAVASLQNQDYEPEMDALFVTEGPGSTMAKKPKLSLFRPQRHDKTDDQ